MWFKRALGELTGNIPYERPWMLDYVDRPWTTDTTKTRQILDWDCNPDLSIMKKINAIQRNLTIDPGDWEKRNISRNEKRFTYSGT